jgi:hypothetical protein
LDAENFMLSQTFPVPVRDIPVRDRGQFWCSREPRGVKVEHVANKINGATKRA